MNFFDFSFWQSFVSNLGATIIGVGLGIPVALLINRWVEDRTGKERRKKILKVILDELKENFVYLEMWKSEQFITKKVPELYTFLYTESWDAFSNGGELEWINDPLLLNTLATCYNKINAVKYNANKYLDFVFTRYMVDTEIVEAVKKRLIQSVETAWTVLKYSQEYMEAVAKKDR